MPYKIQKDGDEFCVYKKKADGSVGEKVTGACHPTRNKANRQMAALYVAEGKEEKGLSIDSGDLLELLKAFSLSDTQEIVYQAFEKEYKEYWVIDVWQDYLVAKNWEDKTYHKIPYSVSSNTDVTFASESEWKKVYLKKEWLEKSFSLIHKPDINDFISEEELEEEPEDPGGAEVPDIGFPIKMLGGSRLGFYGYLWGDKNKKDLHGEYFTEKTDGLRELFDQLGSLPFTYHHAANGVMKATVIGLLDVMQEDDIGMWVEVQIKNHEIYRKFIRPLIENSALYPSGETLVGAKQVTKDGEIKRWVTSAMTGTTAPAEWRMMAYPIDELKSLLEKSGHYTEEQINAVMKSLGADVDEISAANDVDDKPNVDESNKLKSAPEGVGKARLLAAFELELQKTKLAALETELL